MHGFRPGPATLLCLLLFVSGCTSQTVAPTYEAPPSQSVPPSVAAFAWTCPPGETVRRTGDLCVGTLVDPTRGLNEPTLARDPAQASVLAIAVNAQGAGDTDLQPEHPGLGVVSRIQVYTSQDGGASWTPTAPIPFVDAPPLAGPFGALVSYDAALTFGDEGVLWLAGIASRNAGTGGQLQDTRVFVVATRDLGKTWEAPTVLSQESADRPWITAFGGHLFVSWWMNHAQSGALAWSDGAVGPWHTHESIPCPPIPVRAIQGAPTILCWDDSRHPSPTILDLANDTLTPGRSLPESGWPLHLLPGAEESVAALLQANRPVLHTSLDGQGNWSEAVSLDSLSLLTRDWRAMRLHAAEVDPWGVIHVLLLGGPDERRCNPMGDLPRETPSGCSLVHLAVEPTTRRLLDARMLLPTDPSTHRTPPTAGAAAGVTGDDYYGISFSHEEGLLVWSFDGGLDYTTIRPSWS